MKLVKVNPWPAFHTSCVGCGRLLASDAEGGAWTDLSGPGSGFRCQRCKEEVESGQNKK